MMSQYSLFSRGRSDSSQSINNLIDSQSETPPPQQTEVLDFKDLKPLADFYSVINAEYARGATSVIQLVQINEVVAVLKQASPAEINMFRILSNTELSSPFLKPIGIAKQNKSMLFLPKLSCTLEQLKPALDFFKSNHSKYPQILYQLFLFVTELMGALRESAVLHYDIKPENIGFDDTTNRLYLFDFGTSVQFYNPGDESSPEVGTPLYNWSPEYCNGIRTPAFAIESWSLGSLLEFIVSAPSTDKPTHWINLFIRRSNQYKEYLKTNTDTPNPQNLINAHEALDIKIKQCTTVSELFNLMMNTLKHPNPQYRPTFYSMDKASKKMKSLLGSNENKDILREVFSQLTHPSVQNTDKTQTELSAF